MEAKAGRFRPSSDAGWGGGGWVVNRSLVLAELEGQRILSRQTLLQPDRREEGRGDRL